MTSNICLQTAGETEVMSEESQIQHLCNELNIPDNVKNQASLAWQQLKASGACDYQSDEMTWFACLLYIASIDTRLPYGMGDPQRVVGSLNPPCVTVTDLLKCRNKTMLEFFRRMQALKASQNLSEAELHHLMAIKRKYLITSPLYHKFDRVFDEIFMKEDADAVLSNGNSDNCVVDSFSDKKKLCWTLFIYTKATVQSFPQELVATFHLLLCCFYYVISLTPSFQLRPPFDAVCAPGRNNPETMRRLCSMFSVNEEEVNAVWNTCLQTLLNESPQAQGSVDIDYMVTSYHVLYKQIGDIDEMQFLQGDPHLFNQATNSALDNANNNNQNVENTNPAEPEATHMSTPVTPVRAALGSVQHLRSLLQSACDQPSSSLARYFQSCSINQTESIDKRIRNLKETFLKRYISLESRSNEQLVQQRFTMATRLYYRVMESMMKQDEIRKSEVDFSNLLSNESFHRCLLACTVEVVLVTYSNPWSSDSALLNQDHIWENSDETTAFPWVLDVFGITAYDFLKILESFIKAEPKLSREVVKHLQSIETTILEKFAWSKGSPVFDIYSRGDFQATTPGELLLTPGASGSFAAELYHFSVTGRKNRRFFTKVCRLAYNRLQTLCSGLDIAHDLQQKIWTCMEYCIMHRPELLRDRHLDQIIMCSIYAICKVTETEVRFKTIVTEYRSSPHSCQAVYRSVLISPGETDSIIAFYNRVFMQCLKTYILQFSSNKTPTLSPSPRQPHTNLTASPVYKLPGKTNIFISPMKHSPFKPTVSPTQMTPRSRQLYSFGDVLGSAEKLRGINEAVSGHRVVRGNIPSSGKQKRLMFDQAEEGSNQADDNDRIVVKRKCVSQTRKCLQFSEQKTSTNQNSSP